MANRYVRQKILGFCTKYLNLHEYTHHHTWESNEEESMKTSVMKGHGNVLILFNEEFKKKIHEYAILHHWHKLHQ